MVDHFLDDVTHEHIDDDDEEWRDHMEIMKDSAGLFKLLITMRDFPEFITTYLNVESAFVFRDVFR